MCDTFFAAQGTVRVFAKNSDRDPNEPQYLERYGKQKYPAGSELACTYIKIPQAPETAAIFISRPFWMWGAEMGVNEYGVAIGNEAIFTKKSVQRKGLTGMDLVRLGLERSHSAEEAVEIITQLIKKYGQGGNCGFNTHFFYHNSFIIADKVSSYIVECVDDLVVSHKSEQNCAAISNELTLLELKKKYSDPLKSRVAQAKKRRNLILQNLIQKPLNSVQDVFSILRHHGTENGHIKYSWLNGAMSAPCMHAGGLLVNSQTTSSFVYDFHQDRLWVTGTSTPCLSLFKPIDFNDHSIEMPQKLWHQHEIFSRGIAQSGIAVDQEFYHQQTETESLWLKQPVNIKDSVRFHSKFIRHWSKKMAEWKTYAHAPSLIAWGYWKRQTQSTLKLQQPFVTNN